MVTVMQLERQLAKSCAGLVLVTAIVWFRLLTGRISELTKRKINAQKVASRADAAAQLRDARASDNLLNLFETPVLFYALVALSIATHIVTENLINAAWLFVALRAVHSIIHCTYNGVMHRLAFFLLSCLCLFAMWAYAFWRWSST